MITTRFLMILVLLLTGCTPGWTPHTPANSDLLKSPFSPVATESSPQQPLWWKAFGDPQLDELMSRLFQSNLDISVAHSRISQAEAALKLRRAPMLPWLNLSGSAQRQHIPGATVDQTGNDDRLQVVAGYEIDLWNRLEAQAAAAEHQLILSRAERDGLLLRLSAELASRYFIHQEQAEQVRLAGEQRQLRQHYRDFIHQRYQQGLEPSSSLYQAEQALALAQQAVQILQTNLTQTEQALALLLGIRHDELKLTLQPPTTASLPLQVGIPADLLLQRPDLIASWHRLAQADQQLAAAIADRLPRLSLQATLGWLHNNLSHSTINDLFWTLTASALQPLVDGGQRQAQVAQQRALVEQRSHEARLAVLSAISEVEQQLNNIGGQHQLISHLNQRLRSAEAFDSRLQQRYTSGLTNALPWLEARDATLSAQRQLLQARFQLLNHTIQLTRAIGGNWMERIAAPKESA